jgi:hypothetical protein
MSLAFVRAGAGSASSLRCPWPEWRWGPDSRWPLLGHLSPRQPAFSTRSRSGSTCSKAPNGCRPRGHCTTGTTARSAAPARTCSRGTLMPGPDLRPRPHQQREGGFDGVEALSVCTQEARLACSGWPPRTPIEALAHVALVVSLLAGSLFLLPIAVCLTRRRRSSIQRQDAGQSDRGDPVEQHLRHSPGRACVGEATQSRDRARRGVRGRQRVAQARRVGGHGAQQSAWTRRLRGRRESRLISRARRDG